MAILWECVVNREEAVMRRAVFSSIVLLFGCIAGLGCSAPSNPDTESGLGKITPGPRSSLDPAPFVGAPIVSGIKVMDPSGRWLGHWGNPVYGGVTAVPNPLAPDIQPCSLLFVLREDDNVQAWVERVYGPGEMVPDERLQSAGGGALVPSGPRVLASIPERQLAYGEGPHFAWNGTDDNGQPLPPGFYRIFVSAEMQGLGWVDVLLARDPGDIPPGMRTNPWAMNTE
jgi:hypothetical protein